MRWELRGRFSVSARPYGQGRRLTVAAVPDLFPPRPEFCAKVRVVLEVLDSFAERGLDDECEGSKEFDELVVVERVAFGWMRGGRGGEAVGQEGDGV